MHGPDASGALSGAGAGVVVTVTVAGAAGGAGAAGSSAPAEQPASRTTASKGQRDQLHVQLLHGDSGSSDS